MTFELMGKDEHGKPTRVITNNGYVECARPFNEESDAWMLRQLDPNDFEAIRIGRQTEALVHEVNSLRREVFELNRILKIQ